MLPSVVSRRGHDTQTVEASRHVLSAGCCGCRKDSHPAALPQRPYALSWWEAVHVLMERQWKLTVRDAGLVRGRVIQVSASSALLPLTPTPRALCLPPAPLTVTSCNDSG